LRDYENRSRVAREREEREENAKRVVKCEKINNSREKRAFVSINMVKNLGYETQIS
jgi:hypothetical protein